MGKEVLSHSFAEVVSNGEILSVSSPLRIHYICLDYSNVIEREIVSLEEGTPLWRRTPMQFLQESVCKVCKTEDKTCCTLGTQTAQFRLETPKPTGCSYAFLLICLKTTPASSLDCRAHLRDPNFQYWDFKRFSHVFKSEGVQSNKNLLHERQWK